MKFQYDEQGDSFVYFVLAFLVLVLVPSSYFFWPRVEIDGTSFFHTFCDSCFCSLYSPQSSSFTSSPFTESENKGSKCQCDNCEHKRSKLRAAKPSKKLRRTLTWGFKFISSCNHSIPYSSSSDHSLTVFSSASTYDFILAEKLRWL